MTEVKEEEVAVVQMNTPEKNKYSYREIYAIKRCLDEAKMFCKSMKGDMAYAVNKNTELLGPALREFNKKRGEAVNMFASKDENGKVKISQPTQDEIAKGVEPKVVYEDGKEKECREYMDSLLNETCDLKISFRTIPLASFSTAQINTEQFIGIDYFISLFVVEK